MVELLEGTSLVLVVGFGAIADRHGLRAAMLAYAFVPLVLLQRQTVHGVQVHPVSCAL